MEQESKIPFWKKVKISVFGLEEYQKLAAQKISKTIGYLAILMLIFAFFVALSITYRFHKTIQSVTSYIDENIETLQFENGTLAIQGKQNPVIVEDSEIFYGKIIIDTNASDDQIKNYTEDIKTYQNGMIISKDKVIFKTSMSNIPTTVSLLDISNQYHIVNLNKQDIISFLTNNQIYIAFFIAIFIYMFMIYLGTVLVDAVLYSLLGHVTALLSGLRLKFTAIYNIAAYGLTLPIILNLIYMVANILTGYTIQYFSVMYMAITCIYVITAILMIRSDVIKKQIELSKIIEEQEKVRQEMARREQEKQEEEEKERIRKEDEKTRQEEKKNKEEKNGKEKKKENPSEKEEKPKKEEKRKPNSQGPEPQANIKPSNF